MRLLFIQTDPDYRTEYQLHDTLISHLKSEELIEISVLAHEVPNNTNNNITYLNSPIRFSTFKYRSILKALLTLIFLPFSLLLLRRQVLKMQPTYIYSSQHRPDIILGAILSKLCGIPHIIHIHYAVGPWLGPLALRLITRSKNLIAISDFVRKTAIDHGVQADHIKTILNAIPHKSADLNIESNSSIRSEFDWDPSTQIIVCAGRVSFYKGQMDLVKAMSQIVQKHAQAKLLICGSPTESDLDYHQELSVVLQSLNLEDVVFDLGHRSDLINILSQADLFCLPSQHEAFGLVFLEAMDQALPIVAYRSGAVPEIIAHGNTGLLSEPGNIQELTENINHLLSSPSLAVEMGQAGKERLSQIFDPKIQSNEWLTYLHKRLPQTIKLEEDLITSKQPT